MGHTLKLSLGYADATRYTAEIKLLPRWQPCHGNVNCVSTVDGANLRLTRYTMHLPILWIPLVPAPPSRKLGSRNRLIK